MGCYVMGRREVGRHAVHGGVGYEARSFEKHRESVSSDNRYIIVRLSWNICFRHGQIDTLRDIS